MLSGYDYLTGVGLADGCYRQLNIVSLPLPSPAAGADFAFTIPDGGFPVQIVAIRGRLVTSAVVANRLVHAVVRDAAGTEVYRLGFDGAVTATKTTFVTFSPAMGGISGGITTNNDLGFSVPDGPYLPRWTIGSLTTAIDAGDQWSQLAVWYMAVMPDQDEDEGE